MDTGGQGWTGVWSQFGHCLVIFAGARIAVGFVGKVMLGQVRSRSSDYCVNCIWTFLMENKMKKISIIISLFALGCKTVNKDYGMVSSSDLVTEPHKVWTRPLEIGFEMGEYIEAESSTSKFLGVMRVAGDPVKDAAKVPMLGQTDHLSANVNMQ